MSYVRKGNFVWISWYSFGWQALSKKLMTSLHIWDQSLLLKTLLWFYSVANLVFFFSSLYVKKYWISVWGGTHKTFVDNLRKTYKIV